MDDRLPREKKYSWWGKRTRYEKCLMVMSCFCVVVIIYLASNLLMRFPPTKESLRQEVCLSEQCIRNAASILEKIDKTVDPCEDFYKYACGNFIKKSIISNDNVGVSSISATSENIQLQLMNLFEEPIQDSDSYSLKLTKTMYTSCMNTTKIEAEGLLFFKKIFKELGGWPVLEPYWIDKNFDWKNLVFRLTNMGWRYNFFFSMHIGTDMKNTSKHIFTIIQSCSNHETLRKGLNDSTVQASYNFMVELAVLFGADRSTAISDMNDVINFEIDLAKIVVPYEERRNQSASYNPMTIREMQKNYSSFPWLRLINNYLAPYDMLTLDDVVNVEVPKFIERLNNFLPNVKKRTLANYMFSRLVRGAIDYLPENFRTKQLDYLKIVYGKKENSPRWEICVGELSKLNIAVSSVHIKHFFDKTTKQKVQELTTDVRNAFLDTLKRVGWMDRKTKKHAILKAEKMNSFIAYPDEILDDKKIQEYYKGLQFNSNDYYLLLNLNYSKFSHKKHIEKLREPVIKQDWTTQAYTYFVNAYYVPSENTIELPAAILQDSFFDPARPQYMNYATIGAVVGHEITHGFDDTGRQFDKDGNLIDWWEPETNRTFARKSQCFVEQYGNYTVPEIEIKLNGVKNLGENIADNGGIKIAYKGYMKWLERNKDEPSLPGLPYTARQLFWVSAATNWCMKYKKETLIQMVSLGRHAPNYFRVVVPFMNSDYFGRDFNCPLGSKMNPKYKCRVW